MTETNFGQTSFLGGEWGPLSEGAVKDPMYDSAMRLCLNGLPVEEGAWVRRPGTQRIMPTYKRLAAKFLEFASSVACAFACEVTTDGSSGWMRLFSGTLPIFTNDVRTISAASYTAFALSLTLDTNSGWSVGDQVMLSFPSTMAQTLEAGCRGRLLKVTGASTNTLTLKDDIGNDLQLASFPLGALVGATVMRLVRLSAPWKSQINKLRLVQAEAYGVILSALQPPQTLTVVEPDQNTEPSFTLAATAFIDGPYLDPQPGGGTITGYSGSVVFTPSDGTTFSSTDVGRHIRFFSQPAAWASGTAYANGTTATYNGAYWISIVGGSYSNVGVPPGSPLTAATGVQVQVWAPAPLEGQWAWGKITAQAGTNCTVALQTNLNANNGATITEWALGLFQSGSYPICGTFDGGRLWLMGAVANRFDASMSNAPFTFSPTDVYGNVNDNNAISYTLNSKEVNNILWAQPVSEGILCGTLGGEWLIHASAINDPITPTSLDAHKVTKYGSLEHEPAFIGIALAFIQRYGRRVMEYLSDTFSQRFSAKHLNERAKHMTTAGVAEIKYQEENCPVLWARTNAGQLLGCTYRRISRFVSENPVFEAWHKHKLGGSMTINSMAVLPAETGLDDRLYLCVQEPGGDNFVEMLRPVPEATDTALSNAWHCDAAPGNGIGTTLSKCGSLFPSVGPSVPATYAYTSVTVDGDRATTAPGAAPVLPIDAQQRASLLGYDTPSSPHFDGNTALCGLPIPSGTAPLSISYWCWPDGAGTGALLLSPGNGVGGGVDNMFAIAPFCGSGGNQQTGSHSTLINTLVALVLGNGGATLGTLATASDIGYTPQLVSPFTHVMILFHNSLLTVVINDTVVVNAYDMSGGSGPSINIPFGTLPDGIASAEGRNPNLWSVGGSWQSTTESNGGPGYNSTATDGRGITMCMQELWISNTAVDWTSGTVRSKFHTKDSTGLTYIPTDIGVTGSTPFGSKPLVYCAGGPAKFTINRANGRLLTLFGGTGELVPIPGYGLVPSMDVDLERVMGATS